MPAEFSPPAMQFARLEGRAVVADFGGGVMTSDAGALLLGATDRAIGLVDRFAACFSDGRAASRVVHDVTTLVGQRVFGIALGYEDLIDHDALRHDSVLGVVRGRLEARRPGCAPLAGKSTLNRLEHAPRSPIAIAASATTGGAIERLFVDLFLDAHGQAPERLILDLDATDDPLHGRQEGRFFHGYGAAEEVARIVARIRERWPAVEIVLRADSGFAREGLMAWCEANGVDYVFGLARNPRLGEHIRADLALAERDAEQSGQAARRFADFSWSTRKSWSRERRVVAKAEWMPGRGEDGANPRFVVTSLPASRIQARPLYERLYCDCGDMENRIKECQLDLFADRTSAQTMRANQLRIWFASMAYVLLAALRRIALPHTRLARATCGSIRLKLLKIGAQVRMSTRRIRIAMATGCPHAPEFTRAHARLCA